MKFRSTFVGLAAVIAAFSATPSHASGLQLLTDVAIAIPGQPGFGGLSAIEMDRDGRGAVVVSDRGAIFGMEIMRDGGPVSGVGLRSASPLTDAAGNLPARPDLMDSEGIARLPGGGLAISFEGRMRVAIHGLDGHERRHIDPPPRIGTPARQWRLRGVGGGCAGQPLHSGRTGPGQHDPALPPFGRCVASLRQPSSQRRLPARGSGFRRSRAALRAGTALFAGRLRLAHHGVTRWVANGLGNGEVLLQTRMGTHGNLEGISLWRSGGRLIASAVADNNFRQPGATRLVEYIIPD